MAHQQIKQRTTRSDHRPTYKRRAALIARATNRQNRLQTSLAWTPWGRVFSVPLVNDIQIKYLLAEGQANPKLSVKLMKKA
eukprot:scaffold347578_cov28-Prasinocladus_malaysianus.AAC.1